MADSFHYFVGIDWATETHKICVLNRDRQLVADRVVEHTGAGLGELAAWLLELTHQAPRRSP